jgi:hypothetical protein
MDLKLWAFSQRRACSHEEKVKQKKKHKEQEREKRGFVQIQRELDKLIPFGKVFGRR